MAKQKDTPPPRRGPKRGTKGRNISGSNAETSVGTGASHLEGRGGNRKGQVDTSKPDTVDANASDAQSGTDGGGSNGPGGEEVGDGEGVNCRETRRGRGPRGGQRRAA
ncbi:unnamed protein product, partial [Discosporangium mesarthrocarpum]